MKLGGTRSLVALAVALGVVLSASPRAAAEPPGGLEPGGPVYIIYVNLDAFGYDLYELANRPPYAGTPNLNAVLAEGVLFTNATTGVPSLTAPMQTTLVTGAWPVVHGNYFRGYDKQANVLLQTSRENAAETLAEVFARAGLPTASVQQFTLLERGTWWDNPVNLYLEPGGGFEERVGLAIELLRGFPVESRTEWVVMPDPPRFLAIYGDDLDALGHNEKAAFDLPVASDEAGRVDRAARRLTGEHPGLVGLDEALGQLVEAVRERGLYERTVFAIASDHGMTGLSGESSLPDLLATVSGLGYTVQYLRPGESALPDTQVVAWSVGLQIHLAFRTGLLPGEYERVVASLSAKEYYGGHLDREELARRGAHPASGDLIVWPKPPHHFKQANGNRAARGQHDTLDPSSQRMFLALAGPGIRKGVRLDTPVSAADLAPTLAHLAGLPPPAGAQGRVLEEALEEKENAMEAGVEERPEGIGTGTEVATENGTAAQGPGGR